MRAGLLVSYLPALWWLSQQNVFSLHCPPTQGVPLDSFTTATPAVPLSPRLLHLLQPSPPESWEPKGSDLPLSGGLQSPKFSDLGVKLLLVHVANNFSQPNLSFSSWHSVTWCSWIRKQALLSCKSKNFAHFWWTEHFSEWRLQLFITHKALCGEGNGYLI